MSAQELDSDEKFCVSCGSVLSERAELCPDCGVRQDASVLNSDSKFCSDCGAEMRIEAEICPECGIRQSGEPPSSDRSSQTPQGKPDAGEAFELMAAYYQAHPVRGFFHLFVVVLTGGGWATWFLFFWFGTYVSWKDVEGMRALRRGDGADDRNGGVKSTEQNGEKRAETDSADDEPDGWLDWFFNGDLFK